MRIFLTVSLCAILFPATAQVIDKQFGYRGQLYVNNDDRQSLPATVQTYAADSRYDTHILPDGSMLFGVVVLGTNQYEASGDNFTLVGKMLPDGRMDSTFGHNGYFFSSFAGDLYSLQGEPGGKIIIGSYDLVMRLLANGTPDSSFGKSGISRLPQPRNGSNVLRRSDGKYWVITNSQGTGSLSTILLKQDGKIDSTYGSNGYLNYPTTNGIEFDNSGVVVHSNGYASVTARRVVNSIASLVTVRIKPDGVLDAAYGTGGVYTYAGIPSNKIIKSLEVAGNRLLLLINGVADSSFIYRAQYAGGLDSSFGVHGIFNLKKTGDRPVAYDMHMRADSIIMVSATSYNQLNTSYVMAVKKWGSFDSSFGVNGMIIPPFNAGTLQSNASRIMVYNTVKDTANFHFLALKYNGTRDSSLLTAGLRSIKFSGTNETLAGISLQSDGKIIAAGSMKNVNLPYEITGMYLRRFNPDGSVDKTYGNNGSAYNTDGRPDGLNDLRILSGNSTLTAGGKLIRKWKVNGTPDSSFATNGTFNLATAHPALVFGDMQILKLALQPDDKILYTGYVRLNTGWVAIVGRISANGAPDASFGSGGIRTLNHNPLGLHGRTLALTQDNRILVGLLSFDNGLYGHTEVTRLLPDGNTDNSFGTSGLVSYTEQGMGIKPNHLVVLPDRSFLLLVSRLPASTAAYHTGSILHYAPNGVRDLSFGTAGLAPVTGSANRFTVQRDGRILYTSLNNLANPALNPQHVMSMSRLTHLGRVDSSFGTNGHLQLDAQISVNSDYFVNHQQLYHDPVPPLIYTRDSSNFYVGSTFDYRRMDGLVQRVAVRDSLPASSIVLSAAATGSCTSVQLSWQTTNETGSNYFVIDKSVDGITFTQVAQVAASVNFNGVKNYSYTYSAADAATAQYRIRLVGTTGGVLYSNTATSTCTTALPVVPGVESLVIAPNPARNYFTIDLLLSRPASVSFTLKDVSGRTVFTEAGMQVSGRMRKIIPASGLAGGLYVLETYINGKKAVRMLAVAR